MDDHQMGGVDVAVGRAEGKVIVVHGHDRRQALLERVDQLRIHSLRALRPAPAARERVVWGEGSPEIAVWRRVEELHGLPVVRAEPEAPSGSQHGEGLMTVAGQHTGGVHLEAAAEVVVPRGCGERKSHSGTSSRVSAKMWIAMLAGSRSAARRARRTTGIRVSQI